MTRVGFIVSVCGYVQLETFNRTLHGVPAREAIGITRNTEVMRVAYANIHRGSHIVL